MQIPISIPDCYQNFILCRQSCEDLSILPKSGLYIDELEGITIERLASISNEAQQKGIDLLHNKVILAIRKLEDLVIAKLGAYGLYMPLFQKIGNYCTIGKGSAGASADFRGVQITRYPEAAYFASFYIDTIFLRPKTTKAGVSIEVRDMDSNVLLSYTVDLVADKLVQLKVGQEIAQTQFVIGISDADVEMYSGECVITASCCSGQAVKNNYFRINGWNGTDESRASYGIALSGYLKCSKTALMCAILEPIKMAVFYQTGAEILKEQKSTRRNNVVTLHFPKEELKSQIQEWEFEADKILTDILPALIPQLKEQDKFCILCQAQGKPTISSRV